MVVLVAAFVSLLQPSPFIFILKCAFQFVVYEGYLAPFQIPLVSNGGLNICICVVEVIGSEFVILIDYVVIQIAGHQKKIVVGVPARGELGEVVDSDVGLALAGWVDTVELSVDFNIIKLNLTLLNVLCNNLLYLQAICFLFEVAQFVLVQRGGLGPLGVEYRGY